LLARVRRRVIRMLLRRGIALEENDDRQGDWFAEIPVIERLQGASLLGRVATGPRAGQRVLRLGSDPQDQVYTTGGPRHAHIEGFDLHANVTVRAGDDDRLEHLCRYILRPPVAQDALALTPDGKVLLHLRRPWRDGTRAIQFEPPEFLEKLAAIVPRPRTNLLIYHGAFAPRGPAHRNPLAEMLDDVPGREAKAESDESVPDTPIPAGSEATKGKGKRKARVATSKCPYFPWAELLRRIFRFDILACPDCGGRLRLVSTLEHPPVVETILKHLGLPIQPPSPLAARTPAWLASVREAADYEDQSPADPAD
jgi:hypothetical protein